MRASIMRFIVHFDLDFVMTTPDDWATYAELDGTATYQLFRDPEARGVYCIDRIADAASPTHGGRPHR